MSTRAIWVFGYGSLIWHQDFAFLEDRVGFIRHWERRFWQGSHDHRGVPDDPGRVVTLIESPGAICTGKAFLVTRDVLDHLDYREKNGYERHEVTIHFPAGPEPGLVYIAPVGNPAFLGEASSGEIAAQIRRAEGPSGSNAEYLQRLAQALRELDVTDPHIVELERLLEA